MSEHDSDGMNSSCCVSGRGSHPHPVIKVVLVKENGRPRASVPRYMSESAAGMDLEACLEDSIQLLPGQFTLIPTGLCMAIPEGYEGQVRPRSGLAARHGVTVLNSPGTIDSDYRGEIGVLLINHGTEPYTIHNGDRVAQMVIAPVIQPELIEVASLDDTDRGEGGFGSTGFSRADGKRCTDG